MTTHEPDTLTDEEVAALVPNARAAAQEAAAALAAAEADPASVTPVQLAELRQVADHAALVIPAAERRADALRERIRQSRRAETLARVTEQAPPDLTRADELIPLLDALDDALKAFCTAAYAHNERISYWSRELRSAGVYSDTRDVDVTVGTRTWRHLEGGRLVASLVYRALHQYPADFLRTGGGQTITDDGDPYGHQRLGERLPHADGDANLHDIIRKDA